MSFLPLFLKVSLGFLHFPFPQNYYWFRLDPASLFFLPTLLSHCVPIYSQNKELWGSGASFQVEDGSQGLAVRCFLNLSHYFYSVVQYFYCAVCLSWEHWDSSGISPVLCVHTLEHSIAVQTPDTQKQSRVLKMLPWTLEEGEKRQHGCTWSIFGAGCSCWGKGLHFFRCQIIFQSRFSLFPSAALISACFLLFLHLF